MNLGPYSKALGGMVLACAVAIMSARGIATDGGALIVPLEWLVIASLTLGSGLAIWAVPNTPGLPIAKALVGFVTAAVAVLVAATVWPPTADGLLGALIAGLTSLGLTYTVPNAPSSAGTA